MFSANKGWLPVITSCLEIVLQQPPSRCDLTQIIITYVVDEQKIGELCDDVQNKSTESLATLTALYKRKWICFRKGCLRQVWQKFMEQYSTKPFIISFVLLQWLMEMAAKKKNYDVWLRKLIQKSLPPNKVLQNQTQRKTSGETKMMADHFLLWANETIHVSRTWPEVGGFKHTAYLTTERVVMTTRSVLFNFLLQYTPTEISLNKIARINIEAGKGFSLGIGWNKIRISGTQGQLVKFFYLQDHETWELINQIVALITTRTNKITTR